MFVKQTQNISIDFDRKVIAKTAGSDVSVIFVKDGAADSTETLTGDTMAKFNDRNGAVEAVGKWPDPPTA